MPDTEKFVERLTRVWSAPQPQEFAEPRTEDGHLLQPGTDKSIGRE